VLGSGGQEEVRTFVRTPVCVCACVRARVYVCTDRPLTLNTLVTGYSRKSTETKEEEEEEE